MSKLELAVVHGNGELIFCLSVFEMECGGLGLGYAVLRMPVQPPGKLTECTSHLQCPLLSPSRAC